MVKKKKAQKPDYHDNDYRAINDLKRVFGNWHIEEKSDFFSKIEYGQDSMVTIIDGTKFTGAEFRVQSKVFTTKKQVKGKKLSTKIKVSTLNSLADLAMPVILHYVDFVNGKSYWMWLDEWYEQNYKSKWEAKKTIPVSISKAEHIFDQQSKDVIRRRVLAEHNASLLLKKTTIHSKNDKDFDYIYHTNQGMDLVVVNPKHDNPRSLRLPTTEQNARLINEAIEKGVRVKFSQEMFIEGIPNFVEAESVEVTLIPHVPKMSSFLRICFLNESDELLHEFSFVEMKLVQSGSKYKRFEGIHEESNIKILISFDATEPSTNFTMASNFLYEPTASELHEYWRIMIQLKPTKFVQLINLKTNEKSRINSDDGLKVSTIDNYMLRFLDNLSKIEKEFDIKFRPSGDIDGEVVGYAEEIVKAIETGLSYNLALISSELIVENDDKNLILVGHDYKHKVIKIVEDFSKQSRINLIAQAVENLLIPLLGHEISLGPARQIVISYKMLHQNEIQKAIKDAKDDELIEVVFEVEMSESFIEFYNWNQDG